jgi:hypothetical protein
MLAAPGSDAGGPAASESDGGGRWGEGPGEGPLFRPRRHFSNFKSQFCHRLSAIAHLPSAIGPQTIPLKTLDALAPFCSNTPMQPGTVTKDRVSHTGRPLFGQLLPFMLTMKPRAENA